MLGSFGYIEKKQQLYIVCRCCCCKWGCLNLVKADVFTIHIWSAILKLQEEGLRILVRDKFSYADFFFFSRVIHVQPLSGNLETVLTNVVAMNPKSFLDK